ncbi:MAG: NAD-dependent epimerase/dehydratase family protein, partial [Salinivenus sp.]
MKLVVPGGNGFIGSEICRIAVRNGHEVAAFGRTGRPNLSPAQHPWVSDVEWRAADALDPKTYRDLFDGADALIHSVATIREQPDEGVTFDRVNAQSAFQAAEAAVDADLDAFVFLSVRDKPPVVSPTFLSAKRRVERTFPDRFPSLRFATLRPNLVFGRQRPGTATMAAVLDRLPGGLHGYSARAGRPLPVELVAAAAVHTAATDTLSGILDVDQIADLGRTSGLIDPAEVSEPSLTPLLASLGGTALAGWLWR